MAARFIPGDRVSDGRRVGTVVEGPCGFGRCKFVECVVIRFDDSTTTENREAARLGRV